MTAGRSRARNARIMARNRLQRAGRLSRGSVRVWRARGELARGSNPFAQPERRPPRWRGLSRSILRRCPRPSSGSVGTRSHPRDVSEQGSGRSLQLDVRAGRRARAARTRDDGERRSRGPHPTRVRPDAALVVGVSPGRRLDPVCADDVSRLAGPSLARSTLGDAIRARDAGMRRDIDHAATALVVYVTLDSVPAGSRAAQSSYVDSCVRRGPDPGLAGCDVPARDRSPSHRCTVRHRRDRHRARRLCHRTDDHTGGLRLVTATASPDPFALSAA